MAGSRLTGLQAQRWANQAPSHTSGSYIIHTDPVSVTRRVRGTGDVLPDRPVCLLATSWNELHLDPVEKSNGGGGRVLAEEESLGFPVCNLDKAVKCPGMTAKSVRRVLNMTASLPAISSTHRRLHRLPRNTHVYTAIGNPGAGCWPGKQPWCHQGHARLHLGLNPLWFLRMWGTWGRKLGLSLWSHYHTCDVEKITFWNLLCSIGIWLSFSGFLTMKADSAWKINRNLGM